MTALAPSGNCRETAASTTEPRGSTFRSASEAPSITESPTARTFPARFAAAAVRSSGRSAPSRASGVEVTVIVTVPLALATGVKTSVPVALGLV